MLGIDGSLRVSVGLEPRPLELGRMLTVRQVPAVVAAPAALTAPSPGRPRRPTRAGDLRDQWPGRHRRRLIPEYHATCGGPESDRVL